MFVDRVRIEVKAGAGGAGVASFLRQKGRPRGKPTGGSGGRGGDVVVVADPDVASLLSYARHPHWSAEPGTHGEGDLRHGRRGADLELPVPLGTVVGDEAGTRLADLVDPGQRVTVARGGRGGKGNAAFVGRTRRAPSYAEQGEYGETASIALELLLVADAALIGFPNAGKSTLISRLSAARPKIADYPFTTLEPNLGVVEIDDRQYVLADIPGLIEGAAEGKGLGHEFLRHTERARVLVVLLDPTPIQPDDVDTQLAVLRNELRLHSSDLADRPQILVVTKADLASADPSAAGDGDAVHHVSAVTGAGLAELSHAIADAVSDAVRTAPDREGFVLHRPLPPSFTVRRSADGWLVEGRSAARAVGLADLTLPEAADLAAHRLRRLGVDNALAAAGAQPGDDVRIGDLVFTYDPELADGEAQA
ncbi:MAG: GTPase ObgE [Actinomycetota bacterium]|nr:GTPase ObgE [Actinomycetota bacterium]